MGYVPPACWPYPSMHWGGVSARRCLPRGSAQGVCPRGCLLKGVFAWGKGVSATPGSRGRQPPPFLWTDRHLWKHNLRKLRLRAIIINAGLLVSCHFNWLPNIFSIHIELMCHADLHMCVNVVVAKSTGPKFSKLFWIFGNELSLLVSWMRGKCLAKKRDNSERAWRAQNLYNGEIN